MQSITFIKIKRGALLMAAIIVGAAGGAYGNYADYVGISAQGISRGNAMSAVVSDWSAVYYNMAGLGRVLVTEEAPAATSSSEMNLKLKEEEGREKQKINFASQLGINYLYCYPQLKTQIPTLNLASRKQDYGIINIGLAMDLGQIFEMPSFISSIRFGLSLGVMQDFNLVKINDVDPLAHRFNEFGRDAQRTVILAGLGIGFLKDAFGLGVGANVLLGGAGKIDLLDVNALTGQFQMPIQNIKLDVNAKVAPAGGVYFSPGRLWSPLKGLTLAASYRGRVSVIIPMITTATTLAPSLGLNMFLKVLAYFTPQICTAGVAYTLPWVPLTISADVDFQKWSEYWWKATVIAVYHEAPKFKDIWVPRAGLHYKIIPAVGISAGYFYRPTYIPQKALWGNLNLMDADKHVVSGGLEFVIPRMWRMKGDVKINIGYQYQMLMPRTVVKIPQLLYTPTASLNPSYKFKGAAHVGTAEAVIRW